MPVRILRDDDTQVEGPWIIRKPGVTEAEFMRLAGEDDRWELIDGEVIIHSPATPEHDNVCSFLNALTRDYVDLRHLGNVYGSNATLHLATCRKLAADVSFLSTARAGQDTRRWIQAPLDWVCEVASEGSLEYDLGEKLDLYKEHRFGEIWVVDGARRRVHVSQRRGRRYEDRVVSRGRSASSTIPGFWVDVAWLWARPLPSGLSCLRAVVGREALRRWLDEAEGP